MPSRTDGETCGGKMGHAPAHVLTARSTPYEVCLIRLLADGDSNGDGNLADVFYVREHLALVELVLCEEIGKCVGGPAHTKMQTDRQGGHT